MHSTPYKDGPTERQFAVTEIDGMLQEKVIDSATTEWASSILFTPKKNGSVRFCVDYRKLNAVTIRDLYLLPRMDECLYSLGNTRIFSILDANSGYWKVEIDARDREKIAFTSRYSLHKFVRIGIGLKNAPATFERAMDVIFSSVKLQSALIYLDDIVVSLKKVQEHLTHLRWMLTLQRKNCSNAKVKNVLLLC